jgi:hypothetical protein
VSVLSTGARSPCTCPDEPDCFFLAIFYHSSSF